ncbi:MAG TPA: efflux RND transporter periplasmic adaptor subunit [Candidatus Binataceae bacterium]|nr:efflux RND transporter periplasmic adaptor subunit [Candidatus Binataceae bacterium]
METDPKSFSPPPPGAAFYAAWIIAIVAVAVTTIALVRARASWLGHQTSELESAANLGPHVLVKQVSRAPQSRELELPASVRGFEETDIYAKIPGFLKKLNVDKGDRVRKDETIAIIDSPETDQQVANARANYHLAVLTDNRNQILLRQRVVPQQTADETHAAMLQAKAVLDQDIAVQKYEVVTAPFDGIITARNIDPGHLVAAPTAATNSQSAIVTIARLHPVRVYSYVPQNAALYIHNGDSAEISFYEYPERKFTGAITRHPEALSADSRTMLVEVDLANNDNALLPGMYGMAAFTVATPSRTPLVPDDALIFRNGKVYVPIVRNNKLQLAEVALGYDNGMMVEVTKGVNLDDRVAVNVGQAARDGEPVQPVTEAQ